MDAGGLGGAVEFEEAAKDAPASAAEWDRKWGADKASKKELALGQKQSGERWELRQRNRSMKAKRDSDFGTRLFEPLQSTRKWAESQ